MDTGHHHPPYLTSPAPFQTAAMLRSAAAVLLSLSAVAAVPHSDAGKVEVVFYSEWRPPELFAFPSVRCAGRWRRQIAACSLSRPQSARAVHPPRVLVWSCARAGECI